MTNGDVGRGARVRHRRASGRGPRGALSVLAALAVAACAHGASRRAPTPDLLELRAPDSFLVEVRTSEGPFQVMIHRAWSPLAADRAYALFSRDYYAGARIYRMVPGFVAQWGFSGEPATDSAWRAHPLPDEPVVEQNVRGAVSFARSGPTSRNFTLYVNLADNLRLDTLVAGGVRGYPPIGRITEGVAVADGFYGSYTDPSPRQDSIAAFGNDYLRRHFPQLDSIVGTRILRVWP